LNNQESAEDPGDRLALARSPAGRVTLDDPPGRVSRLMSPPAIRVPA
jgi:hypothetical protein